MEVPLLDHNDFLQLNHKMQNLYLNLSNEEEKNNNLALQYSELMEKYKKEKNKKTFWSIARKWFVRDS